MFLIHVHLYFFFYLLYFYFFKSFRRNTKTKEMNCALDFSDPKPCHKV